MRSPESVQRLRRFILDLAVRGKLVPQDPEDEPAAELLKRIAKEKARLVKVGEIRKQKTIPPLTEDELPSALPTNWQWTQIAEIGLVSPRNEAADDLPASFIPMPMIPADYGATCSHEVRQWGDIKKGYTHFAEGDVGLAKITPCFQNGKSVVFRNLTGGLGSGTTELHIVRPLFVEPDFIILFLKCPDFIETGIPKMTGTAGQKRVPAEYFARSPFPLPPLAEQNRIVAKVDELMGLCDRLEAEQTERETTRTRLTAASLTRLTAPDPDEATFREHAAFALDNFASLTARPEQVKALRRTILNLAVRGKLVPQDPEDEPAAELLKRIAKEKARGRRRKQVDIQTESAKELEDVPANWSLVPLITLGSWAVGSGFPKNEQGSTDGPYFFLKVSDMNLAGNAKFITTANNCIDEAAAKRIRAKIHPTGTIIFPKIGGAIATNKRRILTKDSAIDNNCLGITFSSEVNIEWAYLLLTTLDFTQYQAGTAVPALSQGTLAKIPVGLPPVAEQNRIASRVNELEVLCNQMERNLNIGDEVQGRAVSALLHKALDPRETLGMDMKD